ncbi:1,2-phenylacetyl-CoA epoxidase subunit PaaD [Corynebacterium halotolerans]|uniref:Phenylacetic acid degradation protein n=1 Tax=Corynebacterium halotolerans YIM 70093 = DSM 44683 TaxID=1121362 RepID=M1PAM0_9CORY|nr:1,2-phenylacetyl-CoA epoxidase subunit PaaD [Corynebacterium halotolerans]AGF73726.1 phenylacetic acid degradation protein [Corynebacterium halotolerans YIM 70093 = DSM 44683]
MSVTDTSPHPLRPADPGAAQIWDLAATVPDPEIPVISIADLGILRDARIEDGTPVVTITPTYSGCPAMDRITSDVREALTAAGHDDARVELVLQPAWSTDWITEKGRDELREYGIAPPAHSTAGTSQGPVRLTLLRPEPVACPRCSSTNTRKLSHFGSTSCKSLYSCQDCLEPFDYFKVH